MTVIRAMYHLAVEMTFTASEDGKRKLYAKMQHLMRSAPALRVTNGFILRADPEVAIVRPARAHPSENSPTCMHAFMISPDMLSIILGEHDDGDDDDDDESSPDEMEILRRHIFQQRNTDHVLSAAAPSTGHKPIG